MKIFRSSQAKTAAVNVLTSTLVLIVFGGVASWHMRAARLESIDRDLRELGHALAEMAHFEMLEQLQIDALITDRLGKERAASTFYAISKPGGSGFYSSNWPKPVVPKDHPHSAEVNEIQMVNQVVGVTEALDYSLEKPLSHYQSDSER